jgi:hypothetical protein
MVGEAVGTALQSVDTLTRHAADVAQGFLRGDVAAARQGLRDLLHGTETLVHLAALSAQVLGRDIATLDGVDGLGVEAATRSVVDQLMAQLLAQDWSGVASTLERELVAALGQWRTVLGALAAPEADGPDPAA